MNIAIDIELCFSNPTGMGRFTRETVGQLASLDSVNHYTLFHSGTYATGDYPPLNGLPSNFDVVRLRWPRKLLRVLGLFTKGSQFLRPYLPGNLDIYFSPSGLLLPIRAARRIGMLHDINLFDSPSINRWKDLVVERLTYSSMIKRSDAILTVSEYSRQRIMARWKLSAEHVGVVFNGVNPSLGDDIEGSSLRSDPHETFGFQGPYFLWCGAMWKRKNVSTLVRAFSEFRRVSGNEASLVLAGTRGNESRAVDRLIRTLGLEQHVLVLGYVPDADLYELYAGATGFLFPSLYEGFGIPVLEAMMYGTPVIASNRTALPEVIGEAGLLVDPLDTTAISEAMETLLTNPSLRKDLSNRGKQRAAKFTWRRAAEDLLEFFRSTYNSRALTPPGQSDGRG